MFAAELFDCVDPGWAEEPVGHAATLLSDCLCLIVCLIVPLSLNAVAQRITRDEVVHVARLARLELTEDEIGRFTLQLGAILEHAGDVEALDVAGVEPTSRPLPLSNVLRADEVSESLCRNDVMAAAPQAQDGQFRVPPVLGDRP